MIDYHVHLGKDTFTGFSLSSKTMSKRLDKFGLSGAVIFSCPNVVYAKENPYLEANEIIYNSYLEEKRFIPTMFIHPLLDKLAYVEREQEKFRGFKFYPKSVDMEYHYTDVPNKRLIDLICESSKPAILHTGFREGSMIKDLIWMMERKKSPLVFAHSGDLIEEDLIIASKYENVFIDVSPLATMLFRNFFINPSKRHTSLKNLNSKNVLMHLKNLFGSKRIIGGSDSPWCDNLLEDGYAKEIKILEIMRENGFNKSYLKF